MRANIPKGMGGGPQNTNAMIRQAQKMQEDMEALQADLDSREYEISAGGGVVGVKINGKKEILAIDIQPEIVDPDDIETLSDSLVAAVNEAIKREIKEELGADVEVKGKIGVVDDYYNLIHRHNINNYYLCRVLSFGETSLTEDEINYFHLSTLKIRFKDAYDEYVAGKSSKLGRLICARELPVLLRAKEMLSDMYDFDKLFG